MTVNTKYIKFRIRAASCEFNGVQVIKLHPSSPGDASYVACGDFLSRECGLQTVGLPQPLHNEETFFNVSKFYFPIFFFCVLPNLLS